MIHQQSYGTHWLSQLRCFTHQHLFHFIHHHSHFSFNPLATAPSLSLLSSSHLYFYLLSSIFALSPLPILLHWSSSPLPLLVLLTLLCVDQNISLYPVICFTLINMKKGEDEEDEVGEVGWLGGVEEDNRAQMKEKKMREKGGGRKRRWGGGVRWEAAKKLVEGHSPAWNNFPKQIVEDGLNKILVGEKLGVFLCVSLQSCWRVRRLSQCSLRQ